MMSDGNQLAIVLASSGIKGSIERACEVRIVVKQQSVKDVLHEQSMRILGR
jgi:hypothetical protein